MKILSIDTSCDETAAAVTDDLKILSNVVWSQAATHAKFGGVMPSLAQRLHSEKIDWVIESAINRSGVKINDIDAIAVTIGPGLSIALGVGVDKAKSFAEKYKKPLIPINHIEAHLLSPLSQPKTGSKDLHSIKSLFPAYGLCVSGGNTIFVLMKGIGKYQLIAQTVDDALGEALDKGARMLGLGYPGGATLEKMARLGNPDKYKLPIPLVGQEKRMIFSYSGLKTSFFRLLDKNKKEALNFPSKEAIYNLAATYQATAFKHIERVLFFYMTNIITASPKHFLIGGGVAANIEFRKRIRSLGENFGWSLHIPYAKKLYGDNAGMIGVAAYLKTVTNNATFYEIGNISNVDRNPRLKLT